MKFIFLFFALFLIAQPIFSQALIYRKNGEVISVYNLGIAGKTRSYNLPGDAEGIKRYISITAIDSIKYEDGSKDVFPSYGLKEIVREEEIESFNRKLLGLDVAALTFYNSLKLSLEYLPGKGVIGYYGAFSLNLNPQNLVFYDDYQDYYIYTNVIKIMRWNCRTGINAYIFPPGSFRFSFGLFGITGQYTEEIIKYLDEEPWTSTTDLSDKWLSGLFLSPALHWQLNDFLRVTAAVDFGTFTNKEVNNKSIFRTEILLNF